MDDEILLNRISRQDEQALSDLYDRYARLVFSLAYHVLQEANLAEEVTQDVFLSVWCKAETFDRSKAKFTTWLSQIARNRAIDRLRRRNVRPEKASLRWETALQDLEDDTQAVEPTIIEHERNHQVLQIMRNLPQEQRLVISLAYFSGMSQSQIADLLKEPLGTVKTRIRLGMQKLREMLPDSI